MLRLPGAATAIVAKKLQVLGVHIDGGLRPQFVLPARKLHPSSKLTLEQLALVETLGIGCHAVDRANPQPGEHVLVIGAGPIGLSVIEFAKLTGATITVLDMNQGRLDFCQKTMGVAHDPLHRRRQRNESSARDHERLAGRSRLRCDRQPEVDVQRLQLRRPHWPHRLRGHRHRRDQLPDPLFHRREMTIFASRNSLPKDFGRIINLIETGRIDTRPWITHRTPFEGLIEVFPSYTKLETGVIKAIVEV